MDQHTKDVIAECTLASDQERITFPDVVKAMIAAGIERYHTDLVRAERTHYTPGGETEIVKTHALAAQPAVAFRADDVAAAVRAIQRGELTYRAFCDRIAEAGCVGYVVSFAGRRVAYYGRTFDTYVEPFPPAR